MTMQIRGMQIAGVPALAVRNMLRNVHSELDADFVASRCNLADSQAERLIRELVDEGYIEFAERSRVAEPPHQVGNDNQQYRMVDYYKLTDKGEELARASAVAKMPRARADRMLADLMRRVQKINANTDYMYRVSTLIVYGSYVRGEQRLSDVDIAYDLERNFDPGNDREWRERKDRRVQLAIENGRRFRSFDDDLAWPRREVTLRLKDRTKGLSLHELHDFVHMKKDVNFAYRVLIGDANALAEQIGHVETSAYVL